MFIFTTILFAGLCVLLYMWGRYNYIVASKLEHLLKQSVMALEQTTREYAEYRKEIVDGLDKQD